MSGTRFILTLTALLAVLLGGGYAVNHWEELQGRRASVPVAPSGTDIAPVSTGENVPAAKSADVPSQSAENDPTVETRMKKEFDAAAADAAAEAANAGDATGAATTAADKTAETRSIDKAPVEVTASLDAVQLSATGASVIAGQAPTGTKVTLLANDRELASAVADESGAWTMILEEPVAPGSYKLKLAAVGPGGGEAIIREVGEAMVAEPVEETEVAEVPAASATATAEATPAASATAEAAATAMAEPAPAAIDVVVPSTETFDIASVPPDLVAPVVGPVASTAAAEVADAESEPATATKETAAEVADAEPEPATTTTETAATVTESAASETSGAAASETAATAGATQTVQAAETDPSLADQAGEAAETISDMFTDWLTATGDQAEEAARTFTIATATYKPIAKGQGVLTLSGHGPAKAEVRLFVDKVAVGVTQIADTGRWLAEADHWIEPGAHTARAEIIGPDGAVVAGHDLAFASAAAPEAVVATAGSESAPAEALPVLLAISDVAYENMGPKKGRISVGGRAEPTASVAVYADGQKVGATEAGETGDWSLDSDTWIDVGAHAIRAERTSAQGDVIESTLTEFIRPPVEAEVAAVAESEDGSSVQAVEVVAVAGLPAGKRKKTLKKRKATRLVMLGKSARKTRSLRARGVRQRTISLVRGSQVSRVRLRLRSHKERNMSIKPGWYRVRRGDSLWRIADRRYGDGRRYPAILAKNQSSISNPDIIHPSQRLYVP